ncbi:MAG: M20/M25/M40 family metallo-hydrolase [Crocinitomicaceae bacterium]|nr:M20/M25/M40 family metallo-hydrolase [Crocinitomicaceae bacterium]
MKRILICLFIILFGCNSNLLACTTDSSFRISIDNEMFTAPEVLSLYIQKKSLSCEEKNAGEWLKNICDENGLHIYNYGSENGNYNFAATLFPISDSLPNIVLLNHIDVVDAGDSNLWTYPPYSGFITETDIWGRGAFDNKGPAIMQLFSLLEFKSNHLGENLNYNITFLAVSCEETLCDGGAQYVLENHLSELNIAVVIGEGSTELGELIGSENEEPIFGISLAHKRPLWLELNLSIPTSGHGSVTPEEYANKEMAIALSNLAQKKTPLIYIKENKEILKFIAEQRSGMSKFILKHPVLFKSTISKQLRKQPEIFALFSNTVTITSIGNNNSTINMIPQNATAILDCRLLPEFPQEKMMKFISDALENDSIKISIIETMEPSPISSSETSFYKNLESAIEASYDNSNVIPIILPNYSDIGQFRAYGIQGYSIIPIQLDLDFLKCIHAENERIPIKALHSGASVYLKFLEFSQIH